MIDKLMDTADPAAEQQGDSKPEFEGFVECPLFSEEAKITVNTDGLLIAARFDQLPIPYGELRALALADSRVELQTATGTAVFSRMGQNAEWLYQKLYTAYNKAAAKALLVEGSPGFEAEGDYIAEETGMTRQGHAVVRLYEDCLLLLPPNENARRIPLCFLTGMEKGDFSLALVLSTGERYTLRGLGRELDNLERLLTGNLRALRERTMAFHRELTPNLGSMQAAMAAKLMPLGTAADLKKLASAAPPLVSVLEGKIMESRVAQTYPWFRDLCGGAGLTVGVLPPSKEPGESQTAPGITSSMTPAQMEIPAEQPAEEAAAEEPKPILWIIAPDQERRIAAVELALADDEAAATYLYRVEGEWEPFSQQIGRALEAADFRREVILLSDEKLNLPEHLADAMLVKRTPALGLLRSRFMGRAIHSSPGRWKADFEKCRAAILNAEPPMKSTQPPKFCTNCGAKLAQDVKFCGQCGSHQ